MADQRPYPGAPRWVKRSSIVAGIVTPFVVILIILMHAGGGPHHHLPTGDAGGQTPPSSVTNHGAHSP
jgi:hypothetical protein